MVFEKIQTLFVSGEAKIVPTIAAFPRTNSVFNAKKINKNKNPRRHPGYRKERKQDCSFLNYSLIYFYTLPKKFLFFYFVFLFRGAPAN